MKRIGLGIALLLVMSLALVSCSNNSAPATAAPGAQILNEEKHSTLSDPAEKTPVLPEDSFDEGKIVPLANGPKTSAETVIDIPCQQTEDGSWKTLGSHRGTDGYTYRHKLELVGFISEETLCEINVLSNRDDLTFSEAWMASGLSSNLFDYFEKDQAVITRLAFVPADRIEREIVVERPFESVGGGWQYGSSTYRYKLVLDDLLPGGRPGHRVRFVVLSNREDLTFDEAWASCFSSNLYDHFREGDSAIVHLEFYQP